MAKKAKAKIAPKRARGKAGAQRKRVGQLAAKKKTTTKAARGKAKKKKKVKVKAAKPKVAAKKGKARTAATRKPRRKAAPAETASPAKRTAKKSIAAKVIKKKKAASKKWTAPAAPPEPEPAEVGGMKVFPPDYPLPRTHLSDTQLEKFRQLLLKRRAEVVGDVRQLTREVLNQTGGASAERSSMPIHMADLGSDNWEQEFTMGLIANERTRVQEIDMALARIDAKTYGVCLATHRRIRVARLRAKPWAKYCIEYAHLRDEGRVT